MFSFSIEEKQLKNLSLKLVSRLFKISLLVALSFFLSFNVCALRPTTVRNNTFSSIENKSNRICELAESGSQIFSSFSKTIDFGGDIIKNTNKKLNILGWAYPSNGYIGTKGIWMIEISMTKLFPYVSISYSFLDSETNHAYKNEIIEKILGIKKEDLLPDYKDFQNRVGFESYFKEMMYVCESLEKFCEPILNGELQNARLS